MSATDTDEPRAKKRKTKNPSHQACTVCKARKVRCDAIRPRCSFCASHNTTCVFTPVYKRANCSQADVDNMRSRLSELESELEARKSLEETQVGDPPGLSQIGTDSGPRGTQPEQTQGDQDSRSLNQRGSQIAAATEGPPTLALHGENESSSHTGPQAGIEPIGDDSDSETHTESPIIDGMVEYNATTPGSTRVGESFETSATFGFALKIRASLAGDPKLPLGRDLPSSGWTSAFSTAKASATSCFNAGESGTAKVSENLGVQDNLDALRSYLDHSSSVFFPHRHIATALVDRYFVAVHPVWPFLNEEATRKRLAQTWSSDESPKPIWLAQLNLIFAMACEFYDSDRDCPVPDVHNEGKRFYQRGNGFVVAHAFSVCSVPMLQTVLLVALYQQGTMRANECWLTTGHATRMAAGLGLHTSSRMLNTTDPLEGQIRKRLWWGCFDLDRVSSMIYGRPIGIPLSSTLECNNDLPSPVDDKYISLGQSQPDGTPSVNAFFVSTTKLYRVMDKVLECLHKNISQKRPKPGDHVSADRQDPTTTMGPNFVSQLGIILQQDSLLLDWHAGLEPHLRFALDALEPDNEECHPIFRRQRTILKNRFLGMRTLLHRGVLLFLLQPAESRRWSWLTSQKWPPLFLDNGDYSAINGTFSPNPSHNHASLEKQLARLSASICVSAAQLQVEMIDRLRPLKQTGAWWWDFHFTFNSLCILFGVMSLNQADRDAIIPDPTRTQHLIDRGLSNIHDMASRGGSKVVQSEKFLRRLMKIMLRRGREGTNLDEELGRGQGTERNMHSDSPITPNRAGGDVPVNRNLAPPDHFIDSVNMGPKDSDRAPGPSPVMAGNSSFLSLWEDDFSFADAALMTDPARMGNLLESTFDDWAALEGPCFPTDESLYRVL